MSARMMRRKRDMPTLASGPSDSVVGAAEMSGIGVREVLEEREAIHLVRVWRRRGVIGRFGMKADMVSANW